MAADVTVASSGIETTTDTTSEIGNWATRIALPVSAPPDAGRIWKNNFTRASESLLNNVMVSCHTSAYLADQGTVSGRLTSIDQSTSAVIQASYTLASAYGIGEDEQAGSNGGGKLHSEWWIGFVRVSGSSWTDQCRDPFRMDAVLCWILQAHGDMVPGFISHLIWIKERNQTIWDLENPTLWEKQRRIDSSNSS